MSKSILQNHSMLQLIQRGIKQYQLISEGDRILVAVSGGKDSLTMLHWLREIQKLAELRFELIAVHVKTDFHCAACVHQDVLATLFEQIGVKYVIKHIKVLDENRKTSCFWCSRTRRKCLFETAREFACNKIAFGHHKDDAIETTLLNMFYKGEISTMMPNQKLFNGSLAIIRPLWLVEEAEIRQFAQESGFPHQLCRCPFGANSQRKVMKQFVQDISDAFPDINIRSNIINSLSSAKSCLIE